MVFGNVQGNSVTGRSRKLRAGAQQDSAEGEAGDVFEYVSVFDCFGRGSSPGERGVAGYQDAGNGYRVETLGAEATDDNGPGIADVRLGDFFRGEGFGDRNRAMEVVGVGGAEAGDRAAGLGPGGGELGVGVDDTPDLEELAVKQGVCIEVAGGAEGAFDDCAVEIGDDKIGGSQRGVVHAAGLDDDERLGA